MNESILLGQALQENLQSQMEFLPARLGGHILLSLAALLIGVLLSIPLGILASRVRWLEKLSLTLASLIQTIPSLALLALMVFVFQQIGWGPALIALVLYSVLPMLRNTITGIQGVDPAVIEAAQGIGMTDWQTLRGVQLPLAAPTILAGIRTASVWVVGLATIAQPVGATSLGNYIFEGLQTMNYVALLVGCVCSAVLAFAMDQLLSGMERAAKTRNKKLAISMAIGMLAIALSPFGMSLIRTGETEVNRNQRDVEIGEVDHRLVVGGKGFSEQYVWTRVLKARMESMGYEVTLNDGMGSTILFEALKSGKVDCYVDYTGTIWTLNMRRDDVLSSAETYVDVATYLKEKHGVVSLGTLGFNNSYAFAMRKKQADALGVKSIRDLAKVSRELNFAADGEFFNRPEWRSVQEKYGVEFKSKRSMDPTLLYGAIQNEQVDVISAYTTEGRVEAHDLVLLEDPAQAFPPYDAILLVTTELARSPKLVENLRELLNQTSTEEMRRLNAEVDVNKRTPDDVAAELTRKLDSR